MKSPVCLVEPRKQQPDVCCERVLPHESSLLALADAIKLQSTFVSFL